MMILRQATMQDIPELLRLWDEYKKTAEEVYNRQLLMSADGIDKTLKESCKRGGIFVAELNGKIIGGIVGEFNNIAFTGETWFCVSIIYVLEGYRHWTKIMMADMEKLLKDIQVCRFVISSPAWDKSDMIDRYYKILGFNILETHYIKDLT